MAIPPLLPPNPTTAVIGSGAVGGYYGARLAHHGHTVHFLLRSAFQHVHHHGLTIHSCHGDFHLPNPLIHNSPATMPKADLVLVALKTTSADLYQPLITPLLHDSTAILSIQNGLGSDEQLAALFGPHRILGALAFVCINRTAPGTIHHMTEGLLRLGDFLPPSNGPRAQQIVDLLQAANIRAELLPSLLQGRWQKLVWNIPFNGLGALLNMNTQQILATPQGESLVRTLMREVLAAARSDNITFPDDDALIDNQVSRTHPMGPYQTSMQIDRQENRPLEIEAILGEPLRRAQRAGIPTPTLHHLHAFLRLLGSP